MTPELKRPGDVIPHKVAQLGSQGDSIGMVDMVSPTGNDDNYMSAKMRLNINGKPSYENI